MRPPSKQQKGGCDIMIAIYARQSADKKDSLSIEAQIVQCKKTVGDDVAVYCDKGFSGKNTNRPDFKRLFNDIKAGKIDKVCVYRLDRFSRSISDFYQLWDILEKNNVEFVSATEQFDTSTPAGRSWLAIGMVFAQMERESIAERVRDNYYHRHTLGVWLGGPAPFGFNIVKIKMDGKQVSVLSENEKIKDLKFIFKEYAYSNYSLRSLAKLLKEKGIHGPTRETWDNVSLSRILKSPLYVKADSDIYFYYLSKGVHILAHEEDFDGAHACSLIGKRDRTKNKYNDISDQVLSVAQHYGVIDSRTWLAVQDKLENNKQFNRDNAGKYSWLTGLMKCADCGYAIKINYFKSENIHKLICSGKSNLGICDNHIDIDLKELENYVAEKITEALKESPPSDTAAKTKKQAQEILEIDAKIKRLVDVLTETDDISSDYILKKISSLHKERDELIQKCGKTKKQSKPIDFSKLSFEDKKLVAKEFVSKILIRGNNVEIVWRI